MQFTYPLDTLRLRLAVDPASRTISGAARALMREGSHGAFFRGLSASMFGVLFAYLLPTDEMNDRSESESHQNAGVQALSP